MDNKNNNEVNYLLEVLKHVTEIKDSQPLSVIKPLDWDKLIHLASRHGVSPLLYSSLSRQKKIQVPDQTLAILKYQYLHNLKNNITKTTHLVRTLTYLKSRGIPMIPFKGPVIAELAYNDLGLRAFGDVDVLVNCKDFLSVYDLLRKNGWKPATILSERTKNLWSRSRRDLEFVSAGCVMDCHQQLAQGPRFFSLEQQPVEGGQSVTLLDQKFFTLSPEQTVISICLNGTKDQWTYLKPITDLILFLNRSPRLNWDQLWLTAKQMGLKQILLLGLNLCQRILGYTPPVSAARKIAANSMVTRTTDQIINRIFKRTPDDRMFYRFLFMFRLLDNWKFRLRYLAHFLFSPTPRDFSLIPLPDSLYPLYYLIRPLRVGASSWYFAIKTLIQGPWEPAASGKQANGSSVNKK